uniref:Uncharacterized protein n=1 Tax=Clytia hemisphaerica TaxID=252671 RepID=A0A7M5VCL6_9CNID
MAIASGLTCVDYLATNFHSPNFEENQLRYSPTLSYDDLYTNYLSSNRQQSSYYDTTAPLLEFTRLSLAETTFDFTSVKTPTVASNNEFANECEKMKEILNSPKKTTEHCEVTSERGVIPPFSVNRSCECPSGSPQSDLGPKLNNDFNDSEDEEIGAIFERDAGKTQIQPRFDANRFKSSSLPHFNFFSNDFENGGCREEEVSDSEMELSSINNHSRTPSKPCAHNATASSSTRKRRTSADYVMHSNGFSTVLKRPCIDAEKMHRSIRRSGLRSGTRRNLERELFVPIAGKKL